MDLNSIKKKIRGLLANYRSLKDGENPQAAENYLLTAQRILLKYKLEQDAVEREIDAEALGGMAKELVRLIVLIPSEWRNRLLSVVAEANFCIGLYDLQGSQWVCGEENDRAAAIEFYLYFERLAEELAEKAVFEYQSSNSLDLVWLAGLEREEKIEKYKDDFLRGFVQALEIRLRLLQTEVVGENLPDGGGAQKIDVSTALVFIGDKLQRADDWARENENYVENHEKIIVDAVPFREGKSFGEKVALTTKTLNNGDN